MDTNQAKKIAQQLSICASSWDPEARLLSNITAADIDALCQWVLEFPEPIETQTAYTISRDETIATVYENGEVIYGDRLTQDSQLLGWD